MSETDAKTVPFTRRTWDVSMLPVMLAAVAVAAYCVWVAGHWHSIAAPLGVLLLWLAKRFRIPAQGVTVSTMRSTPGLFVLLGFMAATLLLAAAITAFDIYVLGHPFNAPLVPYHALLFSPPFIVMLTGGVIAGRIQQRARTENCQ